LRYVFGFLCVCALALVSLPGCGDSAGACAGTVCPCTEQGILTAIAAGGGPYTFDCDGPTTVVTTEEIVIDKDVILDGDGNLAVDGRVRSDQPVLSVSKGVKAELHRFATKGGAVGLANQGTLTLRDCVIAEHRSGFLVGGGAGISNAGEMTIIDSTVTQNFAGHGVGGGIYNARSATLVLVNSTVSDNGADGDGAGLYGGGIFNTGDMAIINSTVSGNDAYDAVSGWGLGGGIANAGSMSVINSTVSENSADSGDAIAAGLSSNTEIANTLIDGDCGVFPRGTPDITSNGYNIESPGNTCGFDPDGTDMVNVSADDLKLGPLQDNGGPTETHMPGGVVIDRIPEAACEFDTDQRGEPRPETDGAMCDVGSVEVQP
jgi:hypothetical protein